MTRWRLNRRAAAGDPVRSRPATPSSWLRVLVSVLGAFELLMAVSAGPAMTIAVGTIGGLALMTAPWVERAGWQLALLLIGTLPFAVLTWWTVATPLVALLALGIGAPGIRSARRAQQPLAAAVPSPATVSTTG